MKKLYSFISSIILIIGSYTVFTTSHLKAATEKKNESLKLKETSLGQKEIESTANRFIDEEERVLLARLVHAEAKGEPYDGKVEVANVVLNRVENEQFPDTIQGVIYQKNAFEPVQNGSINKPADQESVKAVEEALTEEGQGNDDELLYFYNPDTATSNWISSRTVVKKIGNHSFAI
ncbi:cell wall hydrolase [Mesobacillus zeae]|uniref:Cell wall hydrolase n=1 Tax=Mesobacillus zeae TaxID=1917180 RepID=A0A398AY22_9BACI|nr:cell wall hydrolase [Mesobacillus zeae]RID81944.1 cell wall hydrolase [Mesobacillus zeae]